jgi:phage regulator Rha-like protein
MKFQDTLFPETLLVSVAGGNTFTDSLKVAKHFHKRHDHVLRDIEKLLVKLAEAGISLPKFGESKAKDALNFEPISYESEAGYLAGSNLSWRSPLFSRSKIPASLEGGALNFEAAPVDGTMLRFEPSSYQNARGKKLLMYTLNRDAFSLLVMGYTGAKELRWKIEYIAAFNAMEIASINQIKPYARALDIIRPNLRPVVEMSAKGCNRSTIGAALGKGVGSVTYHRGQAKRLQITH